MEELYIHPRIHERHPEINDNDVRVAWFGSIRSAQRENDIRVWVSIGMDSQGRLLEMVSRHDAHGRWLVYHAMTPPSKKTLYELGAIRRKS